MSEVLAECEAYFATPDAVLRTDITPRIQTFAADGWRARWLFSGASVPFSGRDWCIYIDSHAILAELKSAQL